MTIEAGAESLVKKMCSSIWVNEGLCNEEKYLKKKWFVRNGQETDKAAGWEKPVMVFVVQNVRKKNVCFGPVIHVGLTIFATGKGKAREEKEALNFLVLSKENRFTAIVLDPGEYDMPMMSNFAENAVVKEVLAVSKADNFTNEWFQKFVGDCEEVLLPKIQEEYQKRVGAPFKKLKLKIRTSVTDTASTMPSGSTARGSETKGPAVGDVANPSGLQADVPLGTLVVRTVLDLAAPGGVGPNVIAPLSLPAPHSVGPEPVAEPVGGVAGDAGTSPSILAEQPTSEVFALVAAAQPTVPSAHGSLEIVPAATVDIPVTS